MVDANIVHCDQPQTMHMVLQEYPARPRAYKDCHALEAVSTTSVSEPAAALHGVRNQAPAGNACQFANRVCQNG